MNIPFDVLKTELRPGEVDLFKDFDVFEEIGNKIRSRDKLNPSDPVFVFVHLDEHQMLHKQCVDKNKDSIFVKTLIEYVGKYSYVRKLSQV